MLALATQIASLGRGRLGRPRPVPQIQPLHRGPRTHSEVAQGAPQGRGPGADERCRVGGGGGRGRAASRPLHRRPEVAQGRREGRASGADNI
jgi:hypothetical protein